MNQNPNFVIDPPEAPHPRFFVAARLSRLFGYLRPYWRQQTLALFFLVTGTVASLVVPLLVKKLIDDALPGLDRHLLIVLAAGMVGLHGLYAVCMFITDYFFLKVSNSVVLDLRREMHGRMLRLSMDFFERTKAGQIMARIMGDVDAVQVLTTNAFLMLITDTVALVLMLAFMAYLSWQMTIIGAGSLAVLVAVNVLFNRPLVNTSMESRAGYAGVSEYVHETTTGMREIKAFTAESHRRQLFLKKLLSFYAANFRMGLWGSGSRQLSMLLIFLGPVIVYFYGGSRVIEGGLTIGVLVAFVVYLTRMYESALRLTFLNVQAQSAMGAVDRIFAFLDEPPTVRDAAAPKLFRRARGVIEFKGVSFRYEGIDAPIVIDDMDFRVEAGETVALVGASGSGKTTIVNLVCRFYDVVGGEVRVDGIDVRKLQLADLRAQIGIVPQETFLFHASIADNLRVGKPDADHEEIQIAARLANAHDFITALPGGYDTVVGERGTRLSGGERQRLSIARAILKDPRIVIFDEATSSLDTETERLLKESTRRLMTGRTTLIVSHRLVSVADADRILVLDSGRVVEQGTHNVLVARRGTYHHLWRQQSQADTTPRLSAAP